MKKLVLLIEFNWTPWRPLSPGQVDPASLVQLCEIARRSGLLYSVLVSSSAAAAFPESVRLVVDEGHHLINEIPEESEDVKVFRVAPKDSEVLPQVVRTLIKEGWSLV